MEFQERMKKLKNNKMRDMAYKRLCTVDKLETRMLADCDEFARKMHAQLSYHQLSSSKRHGCLRGQMSEYLAILTVPTDRLQSML